MTRRSLLFQGYVMPKATFFNLPQEKREQILQFATAEFATNDYESASISRIVAQAGIAKGSFYQYFADKADLYLYLLELLALKKKEFFAFDHPDPHHVGVFAYLRWLAHNGVSFELAYPELTRIGYRALTAGSIPPEFYARAREMARIRVRGPMVPGRDMPAQDAREFADRTRVGPCPQQEQATWQGDLADEHAVATGRGKQGAGRGRRTCRNRRLQFLRQRRCRAVRVHGAASTPREHGTARDLTACSVNHETVGPALGVCPTFHDPGERLPSFSR